jgi:hypothetical protein
MDNSTVIKILSVVIVALLASSVYFYVRGEQITKQVGTSGITASANLVILNESANATITNVYWGVVRQGEQRNININVRNVGNIPVTLSVTTANYDPTNAATWLSFNTDYVGTVLSPNDTLPVQLQLTPGLSAPAGQAFSFTILITSIG